MRVIEGDCLEVLKTLPDASIDAVVTDPPYPCIKRDYGVWTEEQWWELMMGVCREVRRILKPTGSAVFILQPNSERVGRMRGWLWEFMAWICSEWNLIQDVWWWNPEGPPVGGACSRGLLRPTVKACVWAGNPDAFRDQDAVLWAESHGNAMARARGRFQGVTQSASGRAVDQEKCRTAAARRGGVTPYNLLPVGNGSRGGQSAGAKGHGAGTPLELSRWWTRYVCPPGGTVLDPFGGSGTMGVAALREGRDAVLVERKPEYVEIIHRRLAAERAETPLFGQPEVK